MAIYQHSSFQKNQLPPHVEAGLIDAFTVTADAVLHNRFDRFLSRYTLPHIVENLSETRGIKTLQEFNRFFSNGTRYYRSLGATELDRTLLAAEQKDDLTVTCATHARARRGTELVQDSYPALFTLICENGVWKFAHSTYGIHKNQEFFEKLES